MNGMQILYRRVLVVRTPESENREWIHLPANIKNKITKKKTEKKDSQV